MVNPNQPLYPPPGQPWQPRPAAWQPTGTQLRPTYAPGPPIIQGAPKPPQPQGFPAPPFQPYPGPYAGPPRQQPPKQQPPLILFAALGLAGVVLILLLVAALTRPSQDGPDQQPETQYQNEDWEVPPVSNSPPEFPVPESNAEARTWLDSNDIYQVALANPVRCDLPLLPGGEVDDNELETHLQDYVSCLTRVWGPALEEAGFEAYQPQITVYPVGGTIQTACGTVESQNAFFCPSDQRIYIAQDVADVLTADTQDSRIVFDLIIAHEYGHAMQARSGLLAASRILSSDANDDKALEYSRRTETQADCFAGTAMNSLSVGFGITEEDRQDILKISFEIGDDQLMKRQGVSVEPGNHGIGENRQLWVDRGLTADSLGTCNTFKAPSSEVK
ncbi:MAG: neutral zinc metallopeptidase [Propionibacteriaceae bacterium]|nr:neutral zinc metallopeptidase [Propionibacteriaceae bacterium]